MTDDLCLTRGVEWYLKNERSILEPQLSLTERMTGLSGIYDLLRSSLSRK